MTRIAFHPWKILLPALALAAAAPASAQNLPSEIQLVGARVLLFPPPSASPQNLTGIPFLLQTELGKKPFQAKGVFITGRFRNGILEAEAALNPESSLEFPLAQGVAIVAARKGLHTRFRDGSFSWPSLANLPVAMTQVPPGAQAPLRLKGVLSDGAYEPGAGISFEAELELAGEFQYTKDPVRAHLKTGTLGVKVEKSEFKRAEIFALGEWETKGNAGELRLGGTLSGKYENGSLDLDASLRLQDDFRYARGPVRATLGSGLGGAGAVHLLTRGHRVTAELPNAAAEIELQSEDGKALRLGGTVTEGRYRSGELDFTAALELDSPFTYQKDGASHTLPAGPLFVRLRSGPDPRILLLAHDFRLVLEGKDDDGNGDGENGGEEEDAPARPAAWERPAGVPAIHPARDARGRRLPR